VTFFNVISKIDLSIIVGIIVSHNFSRDVIDIFTIPSTWAFNTGIWRITIEIFSFWAMFVSPFVFTFDNTIVDFTSRNDIRSIGVTIFHKEIPMFRIDIVLSGELTITIGIHSVHHIIGKHDDIITVPSSFTDIDVEWTVTVDISVIWTVFSSPFIFAFFNTVVDFTSIKRSIIVGITIINKEIIVFNFNVIFWVDRSVHIGIVIDNNFNRDLFNIVTVPSSFTGSNEEWTVTIDMTVVWTVFISPLIFNHDDTSVDFTRINLSVIVGITVSIDFI
jgi:hypothetical protein